MLAFLKIAEMATRRGFTVRIDRWDKWYGKNIIAGHTSDDIAHELAHAAVCPPSRRQRKYFGLGEPCGLKTSSCRVSYGFAVEEEIQASLLGILIDRQVEGNHMQHWAHHNWDRRPSKFRPYMKKLIQKGLVERGPRGWRWNGRFWKDND